MKHTYEITFFDEKETLKIKGDYFTTGQEFVAFYEDVGSGEISFPIHVVAASAIKTIVEVE